MSSIPVSKETISFRATSEMAERLKRMCEVSGHSQTTVLIVALEKYLATWTRLYMRRLKVEKELEKILGELDAY